MIPTIENEYYKFYPKQFNFVKGITWKHVDDQIAYEKQTGTYRAISDDTDLVIDCAAKPGLLQNITEQFYRLVSMDTMHIFSSKCRQSAETLGRHNDDQNVLITQSMGRMVYLFDNGDEVILAPEDGLYIPRFVYHNPVHIEPRITVSMSGNPSLEL